ncbi:MAG: hypothetical protein J3K34DRAFT_494782 [Monoraphidium minutum]|nr:MAG: hypothetical protein J3K34DRAFT_494782 [Monoraphidium minutum]
MSVLVASYVFLATWLNAVVYKQDAGTGILPRIVVGCCTMWLSSFKLIAFVGDRGPLAASRHCSARYCAPPSVPWILAVLLGKAALQAAVVLALAHLRLHPFLVHSLYAVSIWNLVAMVVDASAPVVQAAMGMALNPSMDQPYLSASIQEFWSQRYNLVTTACLRQAVYEPVIDGAFAQPRGAAAAPYEGAGSPPDAQVLIAAAGGPPKGGVAGESEGGFGAAAPGVDGASSGGSGSGSSAGGASPRVSAAGSAGGGGSCSAESGEGSNGSATAGPRRRRGGKGGAEAGAGATAVADVCSAGVKDQRLVVAAAARGAPGGEGAPGGGGAGRGAPEWRKSLGTLLVFVASGLMHEAIICNPPIRYACITPGPEGSQGNGYRLGPVLAFFTLQAPAMQAEKWVLQRVARLRAALLRRLGAAPAPAPPRRHAAALAAAAGRAAAAGAWRAAQVVMVYAWLWGLADFTFWRGTAACRLEARILPELMAALSAARGAAARAAGALQLGPPA